MHGLTGDGIVRARGSAEIKLGWPVLLAAAIGLIPLQFPMHAAGIFMPLWEAEFGWSRSEIGSAMSVYTIVLVVLSPFIGAVIDRLGQGPRIPTLISMALLSVGFMGFALMGGPVWTLYAAYIFVAIVGIGTTAVPFNRVIVARFDEKRGLALAIAQSATAISIFVTPIIVYGLLQHTDWRGAWMSMAIIPIALLPLIWFGLRPVAKVAPHPSEAPVAAEGIAFHDALRSPRLWLFSVSFALFFFGTVGSIGQLVPILNDLGLSTSDAVMLQGVMAGAVLVGRLVTGQLLDRFFASYVYLGVALIGAVGFLILALSLADFALMAVICVGLALGAEIDVASYMTSRYFGVKNYGKIFGIVYSALIAGGIFAHPYYGFIFDNYGSYSLATGTSLILIILGGLLLIRQGPYRF